MPLVWRSPRVRAAIWPAVALSFIGVGALLYIVHVPAHWARDVWIAGLVLTGGPIVWRTIPAPRWAGGSRSISSRRSRSAERCCWASPWQDWSSSSCRVAAKRSSDTRRDAHRPLSGRSKRRRRGRRTGLLGTGSTKCRPMLSPQGDMLLVRPGDLVPCDAVVVEGRSHADASRLTGESLPVSAAPGTPLLVAASMAKGR